MYCRRYEANYQYFDSLTRNSAYVLGYLFGDGCISYKDSCAKYVRMYGGPKDKPLLDEISRDMNSTYPVLLNAAGNNWVIGICSQYMADSLQRKGLHPRKASGMSIPAISGDLLSNFVRGYIDADGWVRLDKTGRLIVGVVSMDVGFIKVLFMKIRKMVGEGGCVGKRNDTGAAYIQWAGSSARKVLNWCKPLVGDLCLQRKWGHSYGI